MRCYSNARAKCRPSKSDADDQLEGGKCTHGGHQQFLINNSNDNVVCQFSYGRFNGVVHLLIEFVVVELFKFKGKMSALKIKCRSPAGGGKMHLGGHQQFLMNNSSDNTVWQFSHGEFNGTVYLLIELVVVELFKCKSKMSGAQIRCRSPAGGGKMHPWWTPPVTYE